MARIIRAAIAQLLQGPIGGRTHRSKCMIPQLQHANGLPWFFWIGVQRWECRGCGATGDQPPFTDVVSFARWAGDLKRAHARCGQPLVLASGEVGHPLNPDRFDR